MIFSYVDYKDSLSKGLYHPPNLFCPYNKVNRVEYSNLLSKHDKNGNKIEKTFRELKKRVDSEYFYQIYPNQSKVLDHSREAFPAYEFILPEVLTDDWLAIVDWHKFQRDHGLHQPLTSYIVLKLLSSNGSDVFTIDGEPLINLFYNKIKISKFTNYLHDYLISMGIKKYSDSSMWLEMTNDKLWKALIVETAYLAATFHDLGYPWQYINLLNNKLINVGIFKNKISNECDTIINQFGDRLLFSPFNKYSSNHKGVPSTWEKKFRALISRALSESHGLPGAIGFLYFYDVLSDYPNNSVHPIRQFCVEWAAMAIMMHDMPNLYWGDKNRTNPENPHLRVKFDTDPLSFVLTLADQIQEFQRPIAGFKSDSKKVIVKYNSSCNATELLLDNNNNLKIIYKYKDINSAKIKNTYINAGMDNEHLFDPQFGYLDYSSLGINSIEMFAEKDS